MKNEDDRNFIALSGKGTRRQRLYLQAFVGVLIVGVIAAMAAWVQRDNPNAFWRSGTVARAFAQATLWHYTLAPAAEQALKPGDSFRECTPRQPGQDDCPDMVVVPRGSFLMGSLPTDKQAYTNELPQHRVTIAKPFAVSKFELTFAEWDTCVASGDCPQNVTDNGWGRGEQPVINVSWNAARQYVAWLSKMTQKPYRLLTEAEYEYATRAGTTTEYPWGDGIGKNNANCNACGSQWGGKQTAPVGSFTANGFGLYDMVGNVWEWVEDCYHPNYQGAPSNGSAWTSGDCGYRVIRGGSWLPSPDALRSALRDRTIPGLRGNLLGFRVGRTLIAP
jgi:formylglycine-generating enzyme required for sulfatase activity